MRPARIVPRRRVAAASRSARPAVPVVFLAREQPLAGATTGGRDRRVSWLPAASLQESVNVFATEETLTTCRLDRFQASAALPGPYGVRRDTWHSGPGHFGRGEEFGEDGDVDGGVSNAGSVIHETSVPGFLRSC